MSLLTRRLLPGMALLAVALPAHAQSISSPYRFLDARQEAGAFAAYVWPAKGSLGLGATKGAAYGARYGLRLGGTLMFQVEGMYYPTEHAVLDSVVVDSAFQRVGTASQSLAVLLGSLRFNITGSRTWHNLQPFVVAGGGVVAEVATQEEEVDKVGDQARFDLGTTFAGTFGGGIAWVPSQHFAIRLDGRNVLWKLKTPDALERQDIGRAITTDEWVQNVTVSAGVSILF